MKIYRMAQEDYVGMHSAPNEDNGVPLHDLSSMYPEDIYSSDAVRLYSSGYSSDNLCISIIQSAKGRPNKQVKIYRAVPDYNYDINEEIKKYLQLLNYHFTYKFFPMNNDIIDQISEKYPLNEYGYDERAELIRSDLKNKVEELEAQKKPLIKINNGDWVAITLEYAKDHGLSNLNGKFKIITKTVRASQLYNDGDSIQEWGYIA